MLTVAFQTLGCKLNQSETETIASAFSNAGFPINADINKAELVIINTCAVTSKAEQKGRRLIRAALRQGMDRCVIVTGCCAELSALETLETPKISAEKRLFIIPNNQKSRILDMPAHIARANISGNIDGETRLNDVIACFCRDPSGVDVSGSISGGGVSGTFRFEPASTGSRSRSFIKIQDGCDKSCAYCLVRIVRGKARSLPVKTALERLRAVENAGMAEAVLTGVNICRWRDELNGRAIGLAGLLQTLISGTKSTGIRLSSLEPDVFTGDFFDIIRHPRIKPHFHLSIQSGSLEILNRMNRFYEPKTALQAIQRLREIKDDPFIACDMISGFPGETERNFSETLNFCETADFAQIHAFPFSRRRGTAAWDYTPRIPEREAEKRVRILKSIAVKNRNRYIERWMNREIGGICMSDTAMAEQTGFVEILTDNYLRLRAPALRKSGYKDGIRKGRQVYCKINGFIENASLDVKNDVNEDAYGELLEICGE
jgi:threonylcarbamoyladenosine tRNA methylthiotransferase MtaB